MPDGKPKRGPGRPKGSKNRRGSANRPGQLPLTRSVTTKNRSLEIQRAAEYVSKALEDNSIIPFSGDAHEYLMSIYKNTELPMPFRLDAAKACIPYEKPKLAAVTVQKVEDLPPVLDYVEYVVIDPANPSAEDIEHEYGQQQQLEYHNGAPDFIDTAEPVQQLPEPDRPAESGDTEEVRPFVGII